MDTTYFSTISQIRRIAYTSLMAAFIGMGAYMHVSIGPVPISFQDLFALLSGLTLGPIYGIASVVLYLFAGCLGLPVFAGGKAGIGAILGPTGGYLIGFIFLAFFGGLGAQLSKKIIPPCKTSSLFAIDEPVTTQIKRMGICLCFSCCGLAALYASGVFWLMKQQQFTFDQAFVVGVVPFIPLGMIKILLCLMLWRILLRRNIVPIQ